MKLCLALNCGNPPASASQVLELALPGLTSNSDPLQQQYLELNSNNNTQKPKVNAYETDDSICLYSKNQTT